MDVQIVMPLQSTMPNLLIFCAAFECESFSKAAQQLGITPQAAGRSVVRLEEALGVTLFRRTTRRVTPTDAARAYYHTVKQGLALLQQAECEAAGYHERRAGLVRVSAPTTFGHHRLLPALAAFRERYPEIELEIHLDNRNIDFTVDGFDLAVRHGIIRDHGLIARKLGDFALGVYAAPSYLARRPAPLTPEQLADHDCIAFILPSTGRVPPWRFADGLDLQPPAAVRCAEDVLAIITLARAGLGLIQTYDFLVEKDVAAGLLVEVLQDYRGVTRPFSLIYPTSPKRTQSTQALIDHLLAAR